MRESRRRWLIAVASTLLVLGLGITATGQGSREPHRHHHPGTLVRRSSSGVLPVGAGGYVTGISFSDDGATRVVRTDTYGGYRWNGSAWSLDTSATALPSDVVHPGLGGGVTAVAAAPSDASIAYMAYDNAIFKSTDGARTWSRLKTGISSSPNDDFRPWGSRLAVDPENPDVVYYGTQLDGLYETRDGGATWTRVDNTALPAGISVDVNDSTTRGSVTRVTNSNVNGGHLASAGINAIAIDRSSAITSGRTTSVYAASYGHGIYQSTDGGTTWTKTSPPAISAVEFLRVLSNGDVLATAHANPTDIFGNTVVWRLHHGAWTQTTPAKTLDWHGIADDPRHPGQVALVASGGQMALSADYGVTWRLLTRTQSSTGDIPWLSWATNTSTSWMSPGEIAFDPVVPGRLWFTEGTGVWYADNVGSTTTLINWQSQSRGIEQLVTNDVIAAPGGKPLLAAWDRPIFRSDSLSSYPTRYAPSRTFGASWSLDWSVTNPNYIVADNASNQWPFNPSSSGYSTDGGQTWTPFPTIPLNSTNATTTFGYGVMAVSTPGNIVWVSAYGKRPYYTKDGGQTWNPITLPGLTDYSLVDQQPFYVHRQVLTADKNTPGTFYLYVLGTGIYRTTDGGDTWTKRSDNTPFGNTNYAWNASLQAVPGNTGELYMSPGTRTTTSLSSKGRHARTTTQPFIHSTDGGHTWAKVTGVTGVTAFGYGKALTASTQATIFIAGYVNNDYGIYDSADGGTTWTKITTYPAGKTSTIQSLDGDKTTPGLAYLSTGGAGWTYVRASESNR